MAKSLEIAGRYLGQGFRAFLIAEVAQAHDGSLGTAHAYVDAAAEAGVDAVKFQTHLADAESTLDEPFRVKFSRQDETRHSYWKRMEFTPEQWAGLRQHALDKGLIFLSSAFSVEAVDLLAHLGMPAWKVGSGEVGSLDLLAAMARAGGPVLLSTGLSNYDEIGSAFRFLRGMEVDVALLQCTSRYPAPLREVGLNVIEELRRHFQCPVGLSDHSGTVYPALAAMARGADIIEAHIVFDRRMFGPDATASLTIEEFKLVASARDAFFEMNSSPVDKDDVRLKLGAIKQMFGKSLALRESATAGTVLMADMLTGKKPGSGIPLTDINLVVGRRLCRDVSALRILNWNDFE